MKLSRIVLLKRKNMIADLSEVNLVLEDTYVIKAKQIPFRKKSLPTLKSVGMMGIVILVILALNL